MTDYDLAAFTRDVTSARDGWRKGTRWPCGADARLSADLDYRQAVRDAAERFLSATRAALAVQQRATTDAISEAGRLSGQLDAARQALDEATSQLAATQAEVSRLTLDLRAADSALTKLQNDDAGLLGAHMDRIRELNDEVGRLQAENRAMLSEIDRQRGLRALQEGQGAAPEPPPVAPLPVRKPRTRKPAGGAQ